LFFVPPPSRPRKECTQQNEMNHSTGESCSLAPRPQTPPQKGLAPLTLIFLWVSAEKPRLPGFLVFTLAFFPIVKTRLVPSNPPSSKTPPFRRSFHSRLFQLILRFFPPPLLISVLGQGDALELDVDLENTCFSLSCDPQPSLIPSRDSADSISWPNFRNPFSTSPPPGGVLFFSYVLCQHKTRFFSPKNIVDLGIVNVQAIPFPGTFPCQVTPPPSLFYGRHFLVILSWFGK